MKVGLGGGCHWCTEGVFQSLRGINAVRQGWIASFGKQETFSEAVLVSFDPLEISLKDLIEIHVYTHASTSEHAFREKYRSAVYVFSEEQCMESVEILRALQTDFDKKIITEVLMFNDFKENKEEWLNYLYRRPEAAFCQSYIHPKLRLLLDRFSTKVDLKKLGQIPL